MKPSELKDYGFKKDMEQKMNVIDLIKKARLEAEKRDIEANAIIIDAGIAFSVLHLSAFWPDATDVPIILGMKAAIDTNGELPDDAAFAIFHAETPPQTKDERIKMLEAENEELRRTMRSISSILRSEWSYFEKRMEVKE